MPKLNTFEITIKTGERGRSDTPVFLINTFPCDFLHTEGSLESGGTFKATGEPNSFAHSLILQGPESGEWDVEEAAVTYHPAGEEPYTIRFGAVTVDENADMNIFEPRPLKTIDV